MVAKTYIQLNMENTNYSITGTEAQKLSVLNKVGITLFTVGVGVLLNLAWKSTLQGKSANKIDIG